MYGGRACLRRPRNARWRGDEPGCNKPAERIAHSRYRGLCSRTGRTSRTAAQDCMSAVSCLSSIARSAAEDIVHRVHVVHSPVRTRCSARSALPTCAFSIKPAQRGGRDIPQRHVAAPLRHPAPRVEGPRNGSHLSSLISHLSSLISHLSSLRRRAAPELRHDRQMVRKGQMRHVETHEFELP